jgi:cyclophilin family peptidyl-prolyl cis-trans isomerase
MPVRMKIRSAFLIPRSSLLRVIVVSVFGVSCAAAATQGGSPLLTPHDPRFEKHAPDRSIVKFDTSKGLVRIEVTRAWAPLGADRFINLVRNGFYDDARFFRAVKDRWIQFGINGDPQIAKAWRYQSIPDDPFVGNSNVKGTIAFAFAVPNGRTTQVFFNMRDNSATHDKEPFVIFGKVIEGWDVVESINTEYGDNSGGGIRAGKQDPVFNEGNAFFTREFPRLDYIKTAKIETP